jgi:hypothetical protein
MQNGYAAAVLTRVTEMLETAEPEIDNIRKRVRQCIEQRPSF